MAAPIVAAAAKALATTFASDPQKGIKIILGCIMAPIAAVTFLFSAIPGAQQSVPDVKYEQYTVYKSACDSKAEAVAEEIVNSSRGDTSQDTLLDTQYKYVVPFKYLMAIDAARYNQDFSKVSESSIKSLLDRFYIRRTETRYYYATKTGKDGKPVVDKNGNVEQEKHSYTVVLYTVKSFDTVVNEMVTSGEIKDKDAVNNFADSGFEAFLADGEFKYNNDMPNFDIPADIKISPSELAAAVPYFSQFDPRWAKLPYGLTTMSNSACGPTSFAMVVNALHGYNESIDTNKDKVIDPYEAACYSQKMGHRITGQGTSWAFFSDIGNICGLRVTQYDPSSWRNVKSALESGNLIIASMGPGEFTSAGHFIVLRGVNSSEKVLANDPASTSRTNKAYDFVNPILYQARQFWVFKK